MANEENKLQPITQVTLSFSDKTWIVTHFEWGYIQGKKGNQPHGVPIPDSILLTLAHNYEQDEIFEAAKSSGDRCDGTLNYISGGTIVKQIPLNQAFVAEYSEVGDFDPDPAVGGGINHIVLLLVDEIKLPNNSNE